MKLKTIWIVCAAGCAMALFLLLGLGLLLVFFVVPAAPSGPTVIELF